MPTPPPVAEVFLAIVVIVLIARILSHGFRRIGQPAVIGEMLAGIVLGTSVLGQIDLGGKPLTEHVFPAVSRPSLVVLANLGLVFFMFIVGMELDLGLVKGNQRVAVLVSGASVVLPFGLGAALALALYSRHDVAAGHPVAKVAFVLFFGASMSVTAFPVLARILTDRGMQRTPLGALALGCAAVDDVIAWSLLALVSAIAAQSSGTVSGVPPLWAVLVLSAIYIVAMFTVVSRLMARLVPRYEAAGRLTPDIMAVLVIGLLLSAWVSDRIGIHFVFGAFLFGACLPREGTRQLFHEVLERLEQISVLVLLPVFFIVTGLSVDVTSFRTSTLGELTAVLVVAIASKFLGAFVAASALRVPRRRAAALGILMNTRGLTELVLLSVGQRLGVLDVQMYSMLVVMALVTTVMTAPLLTAVYPARILRREIAQAERVELGDRQAYRVMVVVEDPHAAGGLLDVALDIIGPESPAQVVLVRFAPQRSTASLQVGSGITEDLLTFSDDLAAMQTLAAQAVARQVPVAVLSRSSSDATDDILDQVVAHGVDVVLVPADSTVVHLPRLVELSGATTATWRAGHGDPAGPVACEVAQDSRTDSAVALAARVARSTGAALEIYPSLPGRRSPRAAAVAEKLSRLGVDASVSSGPADPARLLAVPWGSGGGDVPAEGVLTVVGSRERLDSDLAMLVRQWESAPSPVAATQRVSVDRVPGGRPG